MWWNTYTAMFIGTQPYKYWDTSMIQGGWGKLQIYYVHSRWYGYLTNPKQHELPVFVNINTKVNLDVIIIIHTIWEHIRGKPGYVLSECDIILIGTYLTIQYIVFVAWLGSLLFFQPSTIGVGWEYARQVPN